MNINLSISKTEEGRWKYEHFSTSSLIKLTLTKSEEWEIQGEETENKQEIYLEYQDLTKLIELLAKLKK
jgi:hypothetical protein